MIRNATSPDGFTDLSVHGAIGTVVFAVAAHRDRVTVIKVQPRDLTDPGSAQFEGSIGTDLRQNRRL